MSEAGHIRNALRELRQHVIRSTSLEDLPLAAAFAASEARSLEAFRQSLVDADSNRDPSINVVVKPVGDVCNLRCTYCATRQDAPLRRMSDETLNSILRNAISAKYSRVKITWHGGEPLLAGKTFMRRAFHLAQTLAADTGVDLKQSIQTNGILIDTDWAKLFRAADVVVGISLDGYAELNDVSRLTTARLGTFHRVARAIKRLTDEGVPTHIISVVPDDTALQDAFTEFVTTQTSAPISSLEILFRPQGPADPGGYATYFISLFRLYLDSVNRDYFAPSLFSSILDRLLHGGGQLCWINGTCSRHVGVNDRGDVTPCCDRLTGSAMWRTISLASSTIEELHSSTPWQGFWLTDAHRAPECGSCPWLDVCNSGCTFHRVRASGSPSSLDPYCGFYKAFFGGCADAIADRMHAILQAGKAVGRRG